MSVAADPAPAQPAYKRILLKLSGEALMGEQQFGVDPLVATRIAQDVAEIRQLGVETAIEMRTVAEPFIRRRVIRHLEKGRVVILAAGTGSPYFTTDTAAALRAMEIKAEVILKGTKVDGIYTADPVLDPTATKFPTITYLQVLERRLKVMDTAAISLCMDNKLPIVVFNLRQAGNVRKVVLGDPIGTTV